MIEEILTKYFEDLTVDDINDLLKALKSNERIVGFADVNEIDPKLRMHVKKLCIKENGDYLNITFDFFEPEEENLQVLALNLQIACHLLRENQMETGEDVPGIESILIVKEPICEKHNNEFSIMDEEYVIPIYSLAELDDADTKDDKIHEKLSKIKNMDINEFLSYFLSTLDKDGINDFFKLLDMDIKVEELFDVDVEGFKICRTNFNDYLNVVLRYGDSHREFLDWLSDNSEKVCKEIGLDGDFSTLLLVVNKKGDGVNDFDDLLEKLEMVDDDALENSDGSSNHFKIDELEEDDSHDKLIEEMKLGFGDILDDVLNVNAIFTLMDRDIKIKTFLDFKFDNDDEMTTHKVAIDNRHRLLNLVLYFGHFNEEFLTQEAENARRISDELNNSRPIRTYVILVMDYVMPKIRNVKLDDRKIYQVEFCPMVEIDSEKHIKKLVNEKEVKLCLEK